MIKSQKQYAITKGKIKELETALLVSKKQKKELVESKKTETPIEVIDLPAQKEYSLTTEEYDLTISRFNELIKDLQNQLDEYIKFVADDKKPKRMSCVWDIRRETNTKGLWMPPLKFGKIYEIIGLRACEHCGSIFYDVGIPEPTAYFKLVCYNKECKQEFFAEGIWWMNKGAFKNIGKI